MSETDWLDALGARHATRFRRQPGAPDLLPDPDCALAPLKARTVQRADGPTDDGRRDMARQLNGLTGIFAGRTELELLHALAISYLRRRTPHTAKARRLFRRIWTEESAFLLDRLPARWLVSALQTFHDHGATPAERMAGAVGFLYGNLVKVYETERAAEIAAGGRARRRAARPEDYPASLAALPGMGGFRPGDDVLLNVNVLAYDVALRAGIAGAVLLRLIEITRSGQTIFRRIDDLRQRPEFADRRGYTLSFAAPVDDDAGPIAGGPPG